MWDCVCHFCGQDTKTDTPFDRTMEHTHIFECVSFVVWVCTLRPCVYCGRDVCVSNGSWTRTKTDVSRLAQCCVRFNGSHENTRYHRLIHTYVCCVELLVRLPYWMVFDYYRVMGAWRSFHVNPSYGNKEYRNTTTQPESVNTHNSI